MTAISVNDLSFAFGTNIILDKISFALDEKDKLGVIGVNGCGKSTLFKLILGELEPADGEIFISKGKTVGFLRQDGAFEISAELGRSALEQMYSAFPELLRDEKRLSELESELASCDPHAEIMDQKGIQQNVAKPSCGDSRHGPEGFSLGAQKLAEHKTSAHGKG